MEPGGLCMGPGGPCAALRSTSWRDSSRPRSRALHPPRSVAWSMQGAAATQLQAQAPEDCMPSMWLSCRPRPLRTERQQPKGGIGHTAEGHAQSKIEWGCIPQAIYSVLTRSPVMQASTQALGAHALMRRIGRRWRHQDVVLTLTEWRRNTAAGVAAVRYPGVGSSAVLWGEASRPVCVLPLCHLAS